MKKILLSIAILGIFCSIAVAQSCGSNYRVKPYQDCRGAINICTSYYEFNDSTICGKGAVDNEVPGFGFACGVHESNSTWFTFKIKTAGKLKFVITPLDSSTDYDFMLYRLHGQPNSPQVCSLATSKASAVSSCNYTAAKGPVGIWDSSFAGTRNTVGDTMQNAGSTTTRVNKPIYVRQGETFVLLVDNYSANSRGYSIRFGSSGDSTATIGNYHANVGLVGMDSIACSVEGYNYQWYCNGLRTSDTGRVIRPSWPGTYHVVYNSMFCGTDTSLTYNFTPTGVARQRLANGISISPNPSNGSFSINAANLLGFTDGEATLYNSLGQIMESKPLSFGSGAFTQDWNVSHINKGMYIMEIKTPQALTQQRIVLE